MAALTGDRDTPFKLIRDTQAYGLAANAVIFAGAMVAVNATGWLVPAADAANLVVVGIAFEGVNNTGGANGAKKCKVVKGVAKFAYGTAGNALSQADVGRMADVLDDQTVATAGGAAAQNIPVGPVREVEADGAWLEVGL